MFRIPAAPMIGVVALVSACASRQAVEPLPVVPEVPTPIATVSPAPPPAPTLPACEAFVRPGVLRRAAVIRAVDAGLGRWLANGVEVKERIARARFRGWEIRRLYPGDPCYREVDLRPGDVVLQVNGKPIEKPEQAFVVLSGLRTAPELAVDYLRDGQPLRLAFPISSD